MKCATTKSTVTVQCPKCHHVGPAYKDLLGQPCRCKVCRQEFEMPRHVRMECPGCGATLRVLPEMLDRDVACKFCDVPFRASTELTRPALERCPGEHKAFKPPKQRPVKSVDATGTHQDLEAARAELLRIGRERMNHVEHVLTLEQALVGLLNQQKTLQAELQRLQSEHRSLAEHERFDVESLRNELKRVEVQRLAGIRQLDSMRTPVMSAGNGTTSPLAPTHACQNGNRRILTTRPPGRTASPRNSKAGSTMDRASLRDVIDKVTHCELKAEQLVAQLNSAQQDREIERRSFDLVLARLQDALTRAKSDFDVARGSAGEAAGRLIDPSVEVRHDAALVDAMDRA